MQPRLKRKKDDNELCRPKRNRVVRFVKRICKMLSNWREEKDLERYFESMFDLERRYSLDGDANLDQT